MTSDTDVMCHICKKSFRIIDQQAQCWNICAESIPMSCSLLSQGPMIAPHSEHVDVLICQKIVRDFGLINLVKGSGFRDLINFFVLGYKVRGNKFYTTKLKQMEVAVTKRLTKRLRTVEGVALTTDIWTSSRMEAYMSVTLHCISHDWELCQYLQCRKYQRLAA